MERGDKELSNDMQYIFWLYLPPKKDMAVFGYTGLNNYLFVDLPCFRAKRLFTATKSTIPALGFTIDGEIHFCNKGSFCVANRRFIILHRAQPQQLVARCAYDVLSS